MTALDTDRDLPTSHTPPLFSHFAKPILSPLGAVYNWFATYPYFVFGFFVFVVENCIWIEKHDQHFVSRHWQWMNGMNANQSTSQWVSEPSRHQPAATDNIWQWQWQWLFVCCKRRKKENAKSIDTQVERERERGKTSFHQHSPTCMRIKERAEFLVGDIMVNGKFVK